MAQHYRLDFVLLPQGWAPDALVTVAEDGRISAIDAGGGAGGTGGPQEVERVSGFVVPGMPNAHSHAFQRGMTGNTEYRLSARDSFWTWRQAMYGLANRIEPEDLEVLATQLFIEMLKSGYTSVAEFHYLHRRPGGDHYPDGLGLWDAIIAAAAASGIGLTLLPTLYQTGDFGGAPLKPSQARFASDTDWFLRAVEARIGAERSAAPAALRTGAAFHSLRAVPLETLREAALALRRIDPALPLHIHVAEQIQEVDSCLRQTGRRPLELLLETGLLDEHWCLVHATHATAAELQGISAAKATVCLSITTEANLGDGFFEAARFLKLGGRLCVGSDSQATVCPAEELRWLEYQQRLRKKRRAVLADKRDPHQAAGRSPTVMSTVVATPPRRRRSDTFRPTRSPLSKSSRSSADSTACPSNSTMVSPKRLGRACPSLRRPARRGPPRAHTEPAWPRPPRTAGAARAPRLDATATGCPGRTRRDPRRCPSC